jgi:pimeloyl-ACP methyl ester carboxylesterase
MSGRRTREQGRPDAGPKQAGARPEEGTVRKDRGALVVASVPDRVRAGSPIALVPLGVPQTLVIGGRDTIVPGGLASAYAAAAGEAADIVEVASAGHFELITPGSVAWPAVRDAVLRTVGAPPEKTTP